MTWTHNDSGGGPFGSHIELTLHHIMLGKKEARLLLGGSSDARMETDDNKAQRSVCASKSSLLAMAS